MQLIEIVQLVLVGFIALSLIIFLFSYIGYRTRSRKINDGFEQKIINNSMISHIKEEKSKQSETENVNDPVMKAEPLKANKVKKDKSKFEVFKPKKDNPQIHNPKTIISNFPKKTDNKK